MNIGMLWFDDNNRTTIREKVIKAASYYQQHYGKSVNLVHVHPGNEDPCIDGIEVKPDKTMMANHFWLGHKEN